jgi:hypothetical protein
MKKIIIGLAVLSCLWFARADDVRGRLENNSILWQWDLSSGRLVSTLKSKKDEATLNLAGESFALILGDGKVVKASGFKLAGPPRTQPLPAEPNSPTEARRFPGSELVQEYSDAEDHLRAAWKTILRAGSPYLRQELTLRADGGQVWIKEIVLFDQPLPGAKIAGTAEGSPVVAGRYFCACENPMAQNMVEDDDVVKCSLARNAALKNGESLVQTFVLGILPDHQERRGFLAYVERERAHSYRPFLHYNSWFDIAWDKQKFDEAQSLNAIGQFGRELVQARGVQMDSFLFDDGWDDNKTLWKFHSGFPNGFAPLRVAAAKYHSGIGVWLSPFGGYDEAKRQRLEYARQFGYETNAYGFSLAGPKYGRLFDGICLEMVKKYGVNQFKFDGLAAGARASENGLTRDGDAMLQLIARLRTAEPNIYINQTTGTWPSPFWLLDVDSIWRGGDDHSFAGEGSWCQRWMTYRDEQTYNNVVKVAPLYPLNSLMLHGIIYATNAAHLKTMSDADFAAQTREFFGTGTQLQELYLTPALLNRQNWDDLAEAAKWSRRNADVLVDTHWVGGDPGRGEVYGWASWSPREGILVLRNPTGKPAEFSSTLETLFELPPGAREMFRMKSPWKIDADGASWEISAHEQHHYQLQPFQVLVLEAKPADGMDRTASAASGGAESKATALQ